MKKIIILGTLVLLSAAGCNQNKVNNSFNQPDQVQSQAQSSILTNATKGWKVYTNTKYGFQFKYPESYRLIGYFIDSSGTSSGTDYFNHDPQTESLNKDRSASDPFISLDVRSLSAYPKNLAEVCQKAKRPISDGVQCWDGPADYVQEDLIKDRNNILKAMPGDKLVLLFYGNNFVQKVIDNGRAKVVIFGEVSPQSATAYFHLRGYNAKGDLIAIDSIDHDLNKIDLNKITAKDFENSPMWKMYQNIAGTFELLK